MSRLKELARHIDRTVRGPMWHGPALLEALEGVTPERAAAHPIAGAHSIWEIVLHLTAGYTLLLRRAGGERASLLTEEEWPAMPAPTSESQRA